MLFRCCTIALISFVFYILDQTVEEENNENIDPQNDQQTTKSPKIKTNQSKDSNKANVIIPSPRKINLNKAEPCEKDQVHPSKPLTPAKDQILNTPELKTPPRRMLHNQNFEDVDTSKENSILDVENDQMFDDSIFTEYDDQNLSCMSSKMTKKWRKKWAKEDLRKKTFTTETIDRLVAKEESLIQTEVKDEEVEMSPEKNIDKDEDYHEAHDTSKDVQNASTCSEWFNTTRDEMILFEKFGEEYDQIVNKMSHEEKVKLKIEVDQSSPKDASEILALQNEGNDDVFEKSYDDVIMATPEAARIPPIPKPRTRTPVKADWKLAAQVQTQESRQVPTPNAGRSRLFKSPGNVQNSPNYLKPTKASKLRMSPRKRDVHLSPGYGAQDEADVSVCPRACFIPPQDTLPKHSK